MEPGPVVRMPFGSLPKRPKEIMNRSNPKEGNDFNFANGPNFGKCPRRDSKTQRISIG
jgi:hypothetical protein